jgi:hypothetical protein
VRASHRCITTLHYSPQSVVARVGMGAVYDGEVVAESPIHHRRHGTPPSTTKVSIVKQLTLYAAPLPLDCRWMELHYACPILAGDSWRPIVEVLATSAGFGWYASTPPCQTGDVLETAHLRRKVRPPGRRHVHRWGAGHGGALRRCLVLRSGSNVVLISSRRSIAVGMHEKHR